MMNTGERDWWQTRWFFAAVVLLATLPLLWPAVPPLTDLPGHIGRYRLMLDGGSGPLARWFVFHWRATGNLGVDVIIAVLGPLMGLEPAVKLVTIAIPALTVAGLLTLSRTVFGRVSPYAIAALPLAYGLPFGMGFVNFALSIALALFALSLWLRMAGSRWRAAVFVPVALAIWFCHIFGWAVLGLAIFAVELARSRHPIRAALACWPLAAPLPLMLATAGGGGVTGGYSLGGKLLPLLTVVRDRWMAWDVAAVAVMLGLIGYGLARGHVDRRLGAAAVALSVALIAIPSWLLGSAYADSRVAPIALMMALVALRPATRRQASAIALIATLVFAMRIAGTTASYAMAAAEQERALVALDHIPVGARVVALVRPGCDDFWSVARFDHLGGLVTARRRAFVNDQFQGNAAALLDVRYPAARPFERDPSQFLDCDAGALARTVSTIPRSAFDRVWVLNLDTPPPAALPGMTRLWVDGGHALYRID
ncbi:hypothetical protein [uncultured Sphingomonas sp.]|uniref:hypothetical protein n=1 Tax=uncultured Sphingomonas sp. TaxID=158754 RepID=UPI00374803B3